jgi:hypothetical protein
MPSCAISSVFVGCGVFLWLQISRTYHKHRDTVLASIWIYVLKQTKEKGGIKMNIGIRK